MTCAEQRTDAANIKRAVRSTSTCTPATVGSLKSVLLLEKSPAVRQKNLTANARGTRIPPPVARTAKGLCNRPKKRPELAILELPKAKVEHINPQEKFALATEVVNTTLKALTDVIRRPPSKVTQKNKPSIPKTSSNSSLCNHSETGSHLPLQPLCTNRISSTPERLRSLRRSSCGISSKETSGLAAQAECACIAFAALRSMTAQKSFGVEMPYLQLENGMSALIGKLIVLGLDDLATKELRILKKRLEIHATSASTDNAGVVSSQILLSAEEQSVKKETLSSLLKFQNVDASGTILALIVSSQLQVLKLIASKADPKVTEAAIEHIQLSVPCSPANLIQAQIDKENHASKAKAANQLASLSQLLLSLSPSVSSAEDEKVSTPQSMSPSAALHYQLLAFEIRARWWELAMHRGDVTKEMLEPFARCLVCFRRRSTLGHEAKYSTVKAAFHSFYNHIDTMTNPDNPLHDQSLITLYQILGDLAQDSLNYEEALNWIQKSTELLVRHGASRSRICALTCRTATLQIRTCGKHPYEGSLLISLMDAAKDLEGDLPGDSAELDELLMAVASLRRAVFSILHDTYRSTESDGKWPIEIVSQCSEVLLFGIRFLVRYVGKDPGHRSSEKVILRHLQRLKLAIGVSHPFIESIVALARYSVASSMEDWERIGRGLQDCLELVLSLENSQSNNIPEIIKSDPKPSVFVSLSNAYWHRYVHLKQIGMGSKDLWKNLGASIEIVKNRSITEKIAAILPIKLEKLGTLQELCRDFKKARDVYAEALRLQVDAGCLQAAAQAAATKPIPIVFDNDSNLNLLARLLLAYARTTAKIDDKVPYPSFIFDNTTLPPSERGVLLEQQLSAFSSILRTQGISARLCSAIEGIVSLILAVYPRAQFPIRRFRVANQCFQFLWIHPTIIEGELLDQLSEEHLVPLESQSLGFDVGLKQFIPHLVASQDVSFTLRQDAPNVKAIETRLEQWAKLVQDCCDWRLLQTRVSDISDWLNQLELLADYLEMQGVEFLRLSVLHILANLHEAATNTNYHALSITLIALGLQYVRLGYPGKAGRVLQKVQRYVETEGVPSDIRINWHLAYAEQSLETGDIEKSEQHLSEAEGQFEVGVRDKSVQKTANSERIRLIQTFADVAYIQSSLAAAKGEFSKAMLLSRRSLKLNRRAWAMLARSRSKAAILDCVKPSDGVVDLLAHSMTEMSVSKPQDVQNLPTAYAALQGVPFWPLVPRLFRGLHHLSQIYAHEGLFSETRYYSEESQKIAEAVNAESLKRQALAELGDCFFRSGGCEQGIKLLEQAQRTTFFPQRDRHFAALQLRLASMHSSQGEWRSGEFAAALCEQTLNILVSSNFINSLLHQAPISRSLDVQTNELTLQDHVPARRPQIKRRLPAKKPGNKPLEQVKPAVSAGKTGAASEMSRLSRMKGDVLRQRALLAMYGHSPDAVSALLTEAAKHLEQAQDHVSHEVLSARLHLRQGLERIASDPVFGILPESTFSHPSTRSLGDRLERSPQNSNDTTSPRNLHSKASVRKNRRSLSPLPAYFIDSLHQAQDGIKTVCTLAMTAGTTTSMHSVTDIMAKTLMMLSAITPSKRGSSVSPSFAIYMIELGRIVAMTREGLAIQVEKQLAITQDVVDWPRADDFTARQSLKSSNSLEYSEFQREYIDIIPASWNVISLSLSESRDEIRVSKIRSGQTPFILTLPLNRHNSRDADEEIFGFNQAKTELHDIIALANYSTHDAQDMSRKGAKSEWWEARAALDARLKDLLVSIESIWFGGFRGIFTPKIHSLDLLSRFQQSLHKILDRHLPSRQKQGKGRKSNNTGLDPRVLELFVEMGDPDEVDDLDEPLMDLLYFVIDILQFNGERNAYDEIDFDSIAIETIDALRHYHQTWKATPDGDSSLHTILILDKALHGFPWESLPCVNGHAISRLPSLGCLRDRILRQLQQRGAQPTSKKWQVDRNSGAYVLNPAGDLVATQAKFEQPLQAMAGWESVVGREPTEDEMKDYLENRDIFLYFGHGSGGQYIRSKTIRKLDCCSVALLMGCSSGAMSEAGEFEPYGMPVNYMHAGCPALLATLWDVTDKDIDRFSYTVLEQWGLLLQPQTEAPGNPAERGAKQRVKNKVAMVKSIESERVSLDQAVARGRDACILKYLNGAAPVVYGIPVFLS